jgi:SH3 domain-containing YSC84-like protein 1
MQVMKLITGALLVSALLPAVVQAQVKETRRLEACSDVLEEAMGVKENIPADLLDKAICVAVIPGVKKAAIGVGGRFGYGAISCRTESTRGPWSAPLMISLKGGSLGFQIGGQESDLVLLFMNPKAIDYLLRNKFTLGADASIAAGPVGRNAEAATDAQMRAEILSYSRSRGLFAGISLEGAVLKQDQDANRHVYGERLDARNVLLRRGQRVPRAGEPFLQSLEKYSPRPRG